MSQVVLDARSTFDRLLGAALGHGETAGTCLFACVLLASLLEKFAGCTVRIRGGGDGVGGYFDGKAWRGHYWVEAVDSQGLQWIADITADQFGAAPVVWERAQECAARYRPTEDAWTIAQAQAMLDEQL